MTITPAEQTGVTVVKRLQRTLYWDEYDAVQPALLASRRSICEQSMGVRVMAATVETVSIIVTIHPSCLNNIPAIPVIMVRAGTLPPS